MDQRQRDLLESNTVVLADKMDFDRIAELLEIAKLVSKDRIDEIVSSVEAKFSRNLKLINALQESESPDTFDEFRRILELAEHHEALKLLTPNTIDAKETKQSAISRLTENFRSKLRFNRRADYPLGLNSSKYSPGASETTTNSLSPISSNQDDLTSSSPLKEKHQATLITGSIMAESGRSNTARDSSGGFRLSRNNSGISSLPMIDLSPVVPTSTVTTTNQSYGDNNRLIGHCYTNKYSQTPTRPRELNFMHNRSVSDNEEENSLSNHPADSEPIVCWHPYAHERTQAQSSTNQDQHSRASSPAHCCLPCSYASSESDSSSDSVILDSNLIRDSSVTMALTKDEVHTMKVQKATTFHHSDEDYKMTARPRGPCLIVNNIDFENEVFPTRKGSDEDSKRFDDIFQQLGFTVIMRRNQTAQQMKELFKEVAAQCKVEHDALFVFVLSHGSETGIYGIDGHEVNVELDLLPCFDNRNCKNMRDKPKVFVIQACRGMATDFGGSEGDMLDSIAVPPLTQSPTVRSVSQENRVPTSWLPPSQPSDGKKQRKHPSKTDMLIVYPCLAGYVSVRNELRGSWLGVALAYFIMLHAHERDLIRILNLVTSDVIRRESSNGHIQAIELKLYGWTKNLYFNPETNSTL